jgi:hypothetical protein
MKEHPILFSAPMVRALLNGSKTQTRRIMKPQPEPIPDDVPKMKAYDASGHWWASNLAQSMVSLSHEAPSLSPFGRRGDQLWVRETFCDASQAEQGRILYRADGDVACRWKPSIHMPRKASRIQLEITGVRIERLNDCSEADAKAEGVTPDNETSKDVMDGIMPQFQYKEPYMRLWERINGAGSWAANPWVWVVEFKVVKP